MTLSLTPQEAWEPLPPSEWNLDAARHLLRRAAWTATPEEARRAERGGLAASLQRLFPPSPALFPLPEQTARAEADMPAELAALRQTRREDKRGLRREIREKSRLALLDMSVRWLDYASRPESAAFAKWVLFLSDIYVVSFQKVPRAPLIYRHFDIIARHALGAAPELSKAVSRSPAMVIYLDLNQSREGAPNENFARELFELFLLGEGNYTEADIKESARAFTGYRLFPPGREFAFAPRQHDNGVKTVFGHSGRFDGDDVIDLAYRLPAAGAFLPHEWVKFYLSDTALPREYLTAIGTLWRGQGYDLAWLARRLFGSRIFFAPEFRGNFIKSPVQLYLAMIQDLGLRVLPVPRYLVNPLRQMGQVLFLPPNVRGWVGGRAWINSASLAARRTMVESFFAPLRPAALNAEENAAIAAARADGPADFTVAPEALAGLADLPPEDAAGRMAADYLAGPPGPAFGRTFAAYLAGAAGHPPEHLRRTKRALITVLQSPEYQLC